MRKIHLYLIMIHFLFFSVTHSFANDSVAGQQETITHNLKQLSTLKVFFGHKSVGGNIVDGIGDIISANPKTKLTIVDYNQSVDLSEPFFAHTPIGKNKQPISKIEDFAHHIEQGIGNNADIAFFKFCWVDFTPQTEVEKVLNQYKSTLVHLKTNYPQTQFIHVTVPYTADGTRSKAWIKKGKDIIKTIIGKTNYYDNTKRNEYNKLLRKEYEGREPLFDLSRLESTYPNGQRATFSPLWGESLYTLADDYTDDGGHLNAYGRKIVANELIRFLSELPLQH